MENNITEHTVYTFRLCLDIDDIYAYVHVDPNIVEKYIKKNVKNYQDTVDDEVEVQRQYFTEDMLEYYKQKLIKEITNTDPKHLFNIYCCNTDTYNSNRELFDLK